jgi:hypothetical protein
VVTRVARPPDKERIVRLSTLRQTAAYTVVALGVAASMVACADEPVSPLGVDPPRTLTSSPVPSPTVSPSRRARPPRPTARATTPPPIASSACLGAEIVTVRADDEIAQTRWICLAVGGALWIEVTASDNVYVDRTELVAQGGGASVVEIRFIGPGTVNVSIVRGTQTYIKTVLVQEVARATGPV